MALIWQPRSPGACNPWVAKPRFYPDAGTDFRVLREAPDFPALQRPFRRPAAIGRRHAWNPRTTLLRPVKHLLKPGPRSRHHLAVHRPENARTRYRSASSTISSPSSAEMPRYGRAGIVTDRARTNGPPLPSRNASAFACFGTIFAPR